MKLLSQTKAEKNCSGASFSRHIDRKLQCGVFKTLAVDSVNCQKQCTATLHCFSINTYRSDNGTDICELIKGSMDSEGEHCLVQSPGSEHNELLVGICN